MKLIHFIHERTMIKKILGHLGVYKESMNQRHHRRSTPHTQSLIPSLKVLIEDGRSYDAWFGLLFYS